ncbi:SDR family NAD(P)-dependent oxidoreductase, partial [Staphylococcus capitis]|uniref:SDR family NAD(P)-dependent oxidoreductase n=1 Tax=Staphylococcus capitis TaxID=29388 RepID=UPI0037098888
MQPNVANSHQLNTIIKQLLTQFPSLHLLLNNPPITTHNLLIPIKQQECHHVIHTNLKPLFNSIQKVTPQILPQPPPPII